MNFWCLLRSEWTLSGLRISLLVSPEDGRSERVVWGSGDSGHTERESCLPVLGAGGVTVNTQVSPLPRPIRGRVRRRLTNERACWDRHQAARGLVPSRETEWHNTEAESSACGVSSDQEEDREETRTHTHITIIQWQMIRNIYNKWLFGQFW